MPELTCIDEVDLHLKCRLVKQIVEENFPVRTQMGFSLFKCLWTVYLTGLRDGGKMGVLITEKEMRIFQDMVYEV